MLRSADAHMLAVSLDSRRFRVHANNPALPCACPDVSQVTAEPRGWPYIDTTQASLVLAPVFPAEGDKVDLTTQVCNGGSTSHRADRRYLAGVFMSAPSADWVPSCSDVPDATVVVPSMRVFKLPPPGQAIPPAQSDWPCTSMTFRRVAVPRSNRTRRAAVVALLPEVEACGRLFDA